jgi:hypothetical protein
MARVLVGVHGNSTTSLSASFLAVPGVYARHRVSVRVFSFPTTKPQRRILLTQLVLAWDSLGGFRRP